MNTHLLSASTRKAQILARVERALQQRDISVSDLLETITIYEKSQMPIRGVAVEPTKSMERNGPETKNNTAVAIATASDVSSDGRAGGREKNQKYNATGGMQLGAAIWCKILHFCLNA